MMKKTLIVMLIAIISFGSVLTGCEEDSSSVISMTESISSKSDSSKIDDSSKADSESKNDGKTSGLYKAPENSPVALHGKLSVQGSDLVDEHGEKFQLRGLSTHGLTWYPQFVNEAFTQHLKMIGKPIVSDLQCMLTNQQLVAPMLPILIINRGALIFFQRVLKPVLIWGYML